MVLQYLSKSIHRTFFSLLSFLHDIQSSLIPFMASTNSGAILVNTGAVPTNFCGTTPTNSGGVIPNNFSGAIPTNSGAIPVNSVPMNQDIHTLSFPMTHFSTEKMIRTFCCGDSKSSQTSLRLDSIVSLQILKSLCDISLMKITILIALILCFWCGKSKIYACLASIHAFELDACSSSWIDSFVSGMG